MATRDYSPPPSALHGSQRDAAKAHGIEPALAERAVKKLFQGAGQSLASTDHSPREVVNQFLDFNGSTAEGIKIMNKTKLAENIAKGVEAAYQSVVS